MGYLTFLPDYFDYYSELTKSREKRQTDTANMLPTITIRIWELKKSDVSSKTLDK